MYKIAALLVLCSCTSMDDLYREQAVCLKKNLACTELHRKIERRLEAMDRREYDRISRCPPGYIEYCDYTMQGCGERRSDQYACITPRQAQGIL